MKKIYMIPQMDIVKMESHQLMAGSCSSSTWVMVV